MRRACAAAAVLGLLAAGCGGSDSADAKKAAVDFYTAFRAGDGAKACSLMTPREARSASHGVGAAPSCAAGIAEVGKGLPPATFKKVTVSGDSATVELSSSPALPIRIELKKVGGKWRVDSFM